MYASDVCINCHHTWAAHVNANEEGLCTECACGTFTAGGLALEVPEYAKEEAESELPDVSTKKKKRFF